jgi:hypothetical protein
LPHLQQGRFGLGCASWTKCPHWHHEALLPFGAKKAVFRAGQRSTASKR